MQPGQKQTRQDGNDESRKSTDTNRKRAANQRQLGVEPKKSVKKRAAARSKQLQRGGEGGVRHGQGRNSTFAKKGRGAPKSRKGKNSKTTVAGPDQKKTAKNRVITGGAISVLKPVYPPGILGDQDRRKKKTSKNEQTASSKQKYTKKASLKKKNQKATFT